MHLYHCSTTPTFLPKQHLYLLNTTTLSHSRNPFFSKLTLSQSNSIYLGHMIKYYSLQCILVTHHLQTFPYGETPLQNFRRPHQLLYPYLYIPVKYENIQSMKHNLQTIPPTHQDNDKIYKGGPHHKLNTVTVTYSGVQINKVILTQTHYK